eukprot:14318272-Alexandrium_andersonii.AAC.1
MALPAQVASRLRLRARRPRVGGNSWGAAGGWRQTWSPQEWEAWRSGSWRRAGLSAASASPNWRQSN